MWEVKNRGQITLLIHLCLHSWKSPLLSAEPPHCLQRGCSSLHSDCSFTGNKDNLPFPQWTESGFNPGYFLRRHKETSDKGPQARVQNCRQTQYQHRTFSTCLLYPFTTKADHAMPHPITTIIHTSSMQCFFREPDVSVARHWWQGSPFHTRELPSQQHS